MKNKLKTICKNLYKKLRSNESRTKILVALFLTGTIFLIIGIYRKNIGQHSDNFTYITSISFAIWWILMPITGAEKDKVAKKTCIYILMASVTLYTLSYCLNIFFIANPTITQLIYSAILIFLVILFFVDVFQTLFNIVYPLISKIWGKLSSKDSSPFMNFIKNTMTGLITITAFITAIAGLIKLFIP